MMLCPFWRRLWFCHSSALEWKDPWKGLQSSDSSWQYATTADQAPFEVIWSAFTQSFTSACLLVTHSLSAGVSYSVRRMLSRSFDGVIVMQIVICHSHVWQKSVLLITTVHVVVFISSRELAEILPVTDQLRSRHTVHVVIFTTQGSSLRFFLWCVMSWRSQAEASHVAMRHFLHWPGHITWKECQEQASTVAVIKRALPWGSWWCNSKKRKKSWAHACISDNAMLSRKMIIIAAVKSIKSRVADWGFWLQTAVPSRLSAATGPTKRRPEWVSVRRSWRRMMRSNNWARGVERGLKRKMIKQQGG